MQKNKSYYAKKLNIMQKLSLKLVQYNFKTPL